jgi:hypothetical protein
VRTERIALFVVSGAAFLVALVLLLGEGQCENRCGGAIPVINLAAAVGVICGVIGLRLIGTDDDD